MGKIVPPRAFALDSEVFHISVREAARFLDVSERSVYSYLEKGKLTRVRIEGMTMLVEEEVLAFERRVAGSKQKGSLPWHLPSEQDSRCLTIIIVPLLPECDALLDEKLSEFCAQGKHQITGTSSRAISRTLDTPGRLAILLFWLGESLPSDQQCEQEIAALAADLSEVCDWEAALIVGGRVFTHTS